ncbi:MAG: hypothetical protein IPM54_25650 [Polyangiaceae bacterium]|nr:hypothetical protein [Polyangiaceae bacterium]
MKMTWSRIAALCACSAFLVLYNAACSDDAQASNCINDIDPKALFCPGMPIDLRVGSPVIVSGHMPCTEGELNADCMYGFGPEIIYEVSPKSSGTLGIAVVEATGAIFVHAEDQCGTPSKRLGCTNGSTLHVPVKAGHRYSVVFQESWDDVENSSPFALAFTLDENSVCGNALVEDGEQCDFGLADPAPLGCDAQCQFAAVPDESDKCPGSISALSKPIAGYTTGFGDDVQACGSLSGSPDRIYSFRATKSGTLKATLESSFDAVLSVSSACDIGPVPLLRCTDDIAGPATAENPESVEWTVDIPQGKAYVDYWVVVDGYGPSSFGAFTLNVTFQQ